MREDADAYERARLDLLEGLDEELEMALDDHRLGEQENTAGTLGLRRSYFRNLLDLLRQLVQLQDWMVQEGLKVGVLFEGRDAAGKGGAIKRISQRLNPRVCRVVALQKPTVRERTQWYFQCYIDHLPAAGEIVLFDLKRRAEQSRAGGGVLPLGAGIRTDDREVRHYPHQVLVLHY
jgi:polyphosphate kinase 2 (PPK2 family)